MRRIGKGRLAAWGAAAAIVVAAALWGARLWAAPGVAFDERGELLVAKNRHYEIAFRRADGGIAYVKDMQAGGETLLLGNRDGALWRAFAEDAASYGPADGAPFAYEWQRGKRRLVLRYGGPLEVEATVVFGKDNRIRFEAAVVNRTSGTVRSFRFPYELKAESGAIRDGLLPMLPGVKLEKAFFTESNSYEAQYPGILFAPFAAVRTEGGGSAALYDLDRRPMAMLDIGFKHQLDDAGATGIVHQYKTWIEDGGKWQSPTVVLEVGGGYEGAIRSYRELNGVDKYRSLDDKLGGAKAAWLKLPFLKLDLSALRTETWASLASGALDRLTGTYALHLVAFQPGGHDENYPDFLPPSPEWGTQEAMTAFIREARRRGHRVVPYTNFSWWSVGSPTLSEGLPDGLTVDDVAVRTEKGTAMREDYGPHSGYVMDMTRPFVRERIAEEHKKLLAAGVDGIFEDQWGIRNAPIVVREDLPEGLDPTTAYFEGMRAYFDSVGHGMYTEDGFVQLADDALGFMGSNLLWDTLGYRPNTAVYSSYYPMMGMLARDKVMQYQHNLAAETMTDEAAMLRWNAAMGYQLSGDLFNGTDHPWLRLIAIVQEQVLARYGDALIERFEEPAASVTRTVFAGPGGYVATANWDDERPYAADESFALSGGGFMIEGEDGSVRAGSFAKYNGLELDPGEHLVVEIREDDEIRLYQPVGADTSIRVALPKGWKHAAAAAYAADGTKIADLPVAEEDGYVRFDYIRDMGGKRTDVVRLAPAERPAVVTDFPYAKAKPSVNAAAGRAVRASSMTTADFPPELAVDGDPYTYWESVPNAFPQSLTVDLGAKTALDAVALALPPQAAWEARDQTVEALGSADGERFSPLAPAAPLRFDPASGNRAVIPLGGAKARYVRVVVSGNTAWPAAQIAELEAIAAAR